MPVISGTTTTAVAYTQQGVQRRNSDSSQLYEFYTWTFTNCSATGRYGPTLAQCQSAYSSTSWVSNSSYFNNYSGIQAWTVPKTGMYRIQVAGAPGGKASDGYNGATTQGLGGNGIIVSASFFLTINQVLYILVGQAGGDSPTVGTTNTLDSTTGGNGFNSDTDAGGGGGTFVAIGASSTTSTYYLTPASTYVLPLIVAGGGGAASSDGNGSNAVYQSYQGTSNGSFADHWGYSTGGGWNKYPDDAIGSAASGLSTRISQGLTTGVPDGQSKNVPLPGGHFLAGGTGGNSVSTFQGFGGFGGGGGANDEGGAGGGGWIGGVNGDNTTAASQGGTSYFSPDAVAPSNDGFVAAAATGSGTNTTNMGYCVVTYYGQ